MHGFFISEQQVCGLRFYVTSGVGVAFSIAELKVAEFTARGLKAAGFWGGNSKRVRILLPSSGGWILSSELQAVAFSSARMVASGPNAKV